MRDVHPSPELTSQPSTPRWLAELVTLGPAIVPLTIGVLSLGAGLDGVEALWWPTAALAVTVALVLRRATPRRRPTRSENDIRMTAASPH